MVRSESESGGRLIPADYEIELRAGAPNLTLLLGRALFTSFGRAGDRLPERVLRRVGVDLNAAHVADYARVCGFAAADPLPATYLHMLAFPLSMALMADDSFPFALPGLVHVANRIVVARPVRADERVDVSVATVDLRPHAKGRQFDVVASASVGDEPVWDSTSTYLRRGKSHRDVVAEGAAAAVAGVDVAELPVTETWDVGADIGRRYAAVSGDRNPIHLHAWTARPFGFSTAIAHGMWTAARALGALEGPLPPAFTYDVAFRRPLRLPSQVEFGSTRAGSDWEVGVRGRDGGAHLQGLVRPA